jgi:hypothetical protein
VRAPWQLVHRAEAQMAHCSHAPTSGLAHGQVRGVNGAVVDNFLSSCIPPLATSSRPTGSTAIRSELAVGVRRLPQHCCRTNVDGVASR